MVIFKICLSDRWVWGSLIMKLISTKSCHLTICSWEITFRIWPGRVIFQNIFLSSVPMYRNATVEDGQTPSGVWSGSDGGVLIWLSRGGCGWFRVGHHPITHLLFCFKYFQIRPFVTRCRFFHQDQDVVVYVRS